MIKKLNSQVLINVPNDTIAAFWRIKKQAPEKPVDLNRLIIDIIYIESKIHNNFYEN
jgi:hypothetical protein